MASSATLLRCHRIEPRASSTRSTIATSSASPARVGLHRLNATVRAPSVTSPSTGMPSSPMPSSADASAAATATRATRAAAVSSSTSISSAATIGSTNPRTGSAAVPSCIAYKCPHAERSRVRTTMRAWSGAATSVIATSGSNEGWSRTRTAGDPAASTVKGGSARRRARWAA